MGKVLPFTRKPLNCDETNFLVNYTKNRHDLWPWDCEREIPGLMDRLRTAYEDHQKARLGMGDPPPDSLLQHGWDLPLHSATHGYRHRIDEPRGPTVVDEVLVPTSVRRNSVRVSVVRQFEEGVIVGISTALAALTMVTGYWWAASAFFAIALTFTVRNIRSENDRPSS